MKVAILGAGGFIGSSLVENLAVNEIAEVVPVVRRAASIAAFSRFNLEPRIADANNQAAITEAIKGCDAVVHCVWGQPSTNVNSAIATALACQSADVRRMVYLSTIAVHGYTIEPGTNDKSTPIENQPFSYGASKARAERQLLQAIPTLPVELVILRPGPVYGPKSNMWTTQVVDGILSNTACLVDGGKGICNAIYIGNLLEAIRLCLFAGQLDIAEQAFIVGDQETVTWREFYASYANMFGLSVEKIPSIAPPAPGKSLAARVQEIPSAVQRVLPLMPSRIRQSAEAAIARWKESDEEDRPEAEPTMSRELAALQQCTVKLPHTRAETFIGYKPPFSFKKSMQLTATWLHQVGYPVRNQGD